MTAEFVLDSSLTMAWCFEDEASPETDEIQDWLIADARAHVPTLWHLEIANVLWACERRKRITEADSVRFLAVGAEHSDRWLVMCHSLAVADDAPSPARILSAEGAGGLKPGVERSAAQLHRDPGEKLSE